MLYIKTMKQNTVKISKLLSHNITSLRESRKMSVIELAEKCEVTRQAIYKIEAGENWIGLDMIEKLCRVFKIEEHELFQVNTTIK